MRFLLPLLCLIALLSARTSLGEQLPSVTLPPELARVLEDYRRAWEANDPGALAQLFVADGVALPNGRPPARGAESIRAAYAKIAGSPLALRAFDYSISGDLAYVLGAFAGAADQPDFGKFVLVLRRADDGQWRIVADIDNSNMPMPMAPPEE
ncbi:MAG TPA: DUF4440 domain-containing protein [Steroidobacteraceae bacterium]|nr:DUF4440 domain-containing protein [Steroidobacteraceae bacterium]